VVAVGWIICVTELQCHCGLGISHNNNECVALLDTGEWERLQIGLADHVERLCVAWVEVKL
jgi:hypothetical protein